MGLDQAIYESTTGKIFGVRGQWLFQFNAATGVLEQSARFAKDVTSVSTITVLGAPAVLYLGTTFVPSSDILAGTPYPDVDIYKVGASDFVTNGASASFSKLGLGAKNRAYSQFTNFVARGWQNMVTVGSKLLGYNDGQGLWNVDPTNLPGFANSSALVVQDISVDTVNNVVWTASPGDPDVYAVATDFSTECNDTNGNLNGVCGVTFWKDPTGITFPNGKAYAVNGTFQFWSIDATGHFPAFTNFTAVQKSTGRVNANPIRIKAVNNQAGNAHNGKVLIPTWSDDAVVIWNPLTEAVESVQTGFTAPFDVVVCPTTNWAIQSGPVGLKQIT